MAVYATLRCNLLALYSSLICTGEWLANRDTLKVLTKIQVSKSIHQFASNCIYIYIVYGSHGFHSIIK